MKCFQYASSGQIPCVSGKKRLFFRWFLIRCCHIVEYMDDARLHFAKGLVKHTPRFSSPLNQKNVATYCKSVLANGIRVVSEEIPHVRSVSIGIWVDTGSRDEDPSLNGVSHFIEHMVFKGTKRRSIKDIARSLEAVGGYLNAFTGKEHTCYYARVLDEHMPLAVDVLSDLVCGPTFPVPELEKEKGVVIEELRNAEDDPDDIIHDYVEREVFGEHPLGQPVIGTEKNLRAFTRDDLMAFRREHYTSGKIVVAAAGRIRHEDVVALAEKHLSKVRAEAIVGRRERPRRRDGKEVKLRRPIQQAHVCLGTMAYSVLDKERFPMLVLNTLLGDGMSSRLFQSVRERKGYAYSVYSFVNTLSDTGTFGVYAGLDKENIGRASDLIWKELELLCKRPVAGPELRRTKDQLKGSMMLSLESIPNRMMRLGGSELALGKLPTLDSILESIDAVTNEDILRVAGDILRRDRCATVIIEPDGSSGPKE